MPFSKQLVQTEKTCTTCTCTTTGCCPSLTRFRSFSCSHTASKRCICVACKWKHTIFCLILKAIVFMSQHFKKQTIQLCWLTAQQRAKLTLYFEQQLGAEKMKVMWLQTHLTGSHLEDCASQVSAPLQNLPAQQNASFCCSVMAEANAINAGTDVW